jgi:hypothetical protein
VASTDGPETGCGPVTTAAGVGRAVTAGGEAAAGATEGGSNGPTSVPTWLTLPSAAKPQLSRLFAELISVSAGQCSSVTMSVTPCRLAIPT